MAHEQIYVVSVGAGTPIGRDAWSSAAAVRAAVSAFGQHPYMIDSTGEPVRAAIAPWIDIGVMGVSRFETLLYAAIDQVLACFPLQVGKAPRVALSLGLPSERPGLPNDLPHQLLRSVSARYRGVFHLAASFPNGHAAGLLALEAAVGKLLQRAVDACVVAGVDSYIEPETLEWLERCEQLHSAGSLNNAWGFIPGEGAGALLLVRESVARALQFEPLAVVLGTGSAYEPKKIKTETVCTGEALALAFRAALAALPEGMQVSDVYCDMNGEPYRADEYGFACMRTRGAFASASDFIAPADCWGDMGAAGGPLHLVLALISGAKAYARGRCAFAWASSEGGQRAAALLHLTAGA